MLSACSLAASHLHNCQAVCKHTEHPRFPRTYRLHGGAQLSKRVIPARVMSISAAVQQVVQMHAADVHEDELSDGIGALWGGDVVGSGTDEDKSTGPLTRAQSIWISGLVSPE